MRSWKTSSGDSVEKFAAASRCQVCQCYSCTCQPTPTHDVGIQSFTNTTNSRANAEIL